MKHMTRHIAQETGLRRSTTPNPKRIISEAKNQKAARSMAGGKDEGLMLKDEKSVAKELDADLAGSF
jgi:hypothetical protein